MKPTILVTGGAGYIGSHVTLELSRAGYGVRVLDNLSVGHAAAVPADVLHVGDIADRELVTTIVKQHGIKAVMHFAADTLVDESVREPRKYFSNNTFKTDRMVGALLDAGVRSMVFSSSAAVYGEPQKVPITENDSKYPTNAYGESKLLTEYILRHYDTAYQLKSVSLRYFNACGADPAGGAGEDHKPETHLIPIILQVALGQRERIFIYGDDYPTHDGTCVRDYIHVTDLAAAHILALEWLLAGNPTRSYNLGNGEGHTVKEVVETARTVTGHPIPTQTTERRPGDPVRLIAGAQRITAELGWRPQYTELHDIIQTAWNWHQIHPHGYGG
ncbi:UDP-glucose 4-epimerase GalE [bacterium]|nr:UDP-glucose 4-epimerase GalE [candidate division CSSED10-310 bacterium]